MNELRQFSVIILTLFSFAPELLAANKLYLDFTLLSKHIDAAERVNEINPGMGLSYFIGEKCELRGGGYYNSYKRPTFYLTANYIPLSADTEDFNFNFGIAAGFATGYKDGEISIFGKSPIFYGIIPVLAPNVGILFKPANTRIVFLLLGNAFALQISYLIF